MNGRRDFLKSLAGGAVAGFPAIVPSSALGRDGYVAPSERIVMGAIGVGRMGSGDMRSFLSRPEVRMAAICDVQQARQEQNQTLVNARYKDNSCKTYYDFRELLERSDIDAVLIAPGERWHALMTIAAANRGKHTYTEKPIGLSVAECKAVREAVNRNGVAFQLGTTRRSDFYYRQAVELVRNERIGQLKTIMIGSGHGTPGRPLYGEPKDPPPGFNYDLWLGPSPWAPYSDLRVSIAAWLFISDYGLGDLDGAWGIHDLVIAQWVNDSDTTGPLDVEGTGRCSVYTDIRDTPYEWTVEHTYANGVRLVHMDMDTAMKRAPEFRLLPNSNGAAVIYGTKGWIYVSREGIITNPPSLATEKIAPDKIQVTRSNDHHQNFLNAIRTGQQTICHVEVAVRAQEIAQMEYISLCLGRKLRWDPVAEEFIGDAEANRFLTRAMRSPWHL
jgi:predicted dehydrogenase